DFCPGGALGVRGGDEIITRVNRTVALFERRHRPVLFTRDWHPRETKHFKEFGGAWPAHCIQGTKGARFHPDLQLPAGSLILSKGMDPEQDSYSAFQAFTDRGRDLESTLLELDVDELFICGLATDYCVRATTLDGLRRGLAIRVLRDSIRGVHLKTPSGTSEFLAFRDETLDPPALVVKAGSTELRYHLRCINDLHSMLKSRGDWMPLGSADEQKPAAEGTIEAWGRSPKNPVGG